MCKVSVIMPCYNDGMYIEESIQSVMMQTYKEVELILINDGSTDALTNQILKKYESKGIILLNTNQIGPAAARNRGIQYATGQYILPLDADDKIEPTYIEKAVYAMEQNEKVGIVYCKAEWFGERRGSWELPPYTLKRMLVDNVIFVTALFRKTDWEQVGGFCTQLQVGMEDYDFWLSLVELGREVYQIPEVLFYYRKKKQSRTVQFQQDAGTVTQTYELIYKRHPKLYTQYGELYLEGLREEWVQQVLWKNRLKQRLGMLQKVLYIPWIKRSLK